MTDISIIRLKEYLMGKIDRTDLVEVDKVNRYCSLTSLMRKLRIQTNKDGVVVTTKNASQEFTKAHPALEKMISLNAQLLSIEKSFRFIDGDTSIPDGSAFDDGELV